MDELKNCPFCGGPAEMRVQPHTPNGYEYTPRCKDKSCMGRAVKWHLSRETAIYAWNRRAKE